MPITRWHGTTMATGLRALARPTARLASQRAGGLAEAAGERAVGECRPGGDPAQRRPDRLLERRAFGSHGNLVESIELTGQIGAQAAGEALGVIGLGDPGIAARPQQPHHPGLLVGVVQRAQAAAIGDQIEAADGRVDAVDR